MKLAVSAFIVWFQVLVVLYFVGLVAFAVAVGRHDVFRGERWTSRHARGVLVVFGILAGLGLLAWTFGR